MAIKYIGKWAIRKTYFDHDFCVPVRFAPQIVLPFLKT